MLFRSKAGIGCNRPHRIFAYSHEKLFALGCISRSNQARFCPACFSPPSEKNVSAYFPSVQTRPAARFVSTIPRIASPASNMFTKYTLTQRAVYMIYSSCPSGRQTGRLHITFAPQYITSNQTPLSKPRKITARPAKAGLRILKRIRPSVPFMKEVKNCWHIIC